MNPFVTNGYAGAEYFCDREKETGDIVSFLTNGNNIALISPRRYGKTDLIRHCFEQKEIKDHYYTFIIDIYSTKSLSEMVNKMGKTILEVLKPKGKRHWESFLNVVHSLRAGITYDALGQPAWNVSVGDIVNPNNTLDEIFRYLQQADKHCLVAIDEFQQILKYSDTICFHGFAATSDGRYVRIAQPSFLPKCYGDEPGPDIIGKILGFL